MKRIYNLLIIFCFLICLCPVVNAEEIDPMGINVYENGMSRDEYYEQSIAQYAAFDYSDPQTTPDTDLFGVWDEENGVWKTEPLLDYEGKPGLEEVEAAAKEANGNYAECKSILFEYYKEKFSNFKITMSGSNNNATMLTHEMRFENWTTRPALGPLPMSKLLVSENAGWITSTVIDAVTGVIGANDKRVTLHLYALKKDGYTAIFDSAEGEHAPYIEATVNGVVRTFYPVEDTYVAAGDNQNTNYSSDDRLLAEESYSSIGLLQAVDDYTRRSVLKFDFSSINDTDKVTSAMLHIYGHMEKSDNPTESDIDKNSKIVFVLNDTFGNGWLAENLTWRNYFATATWVCLCYDGTAGYENESIYNYFPGVVNYKSSIMGMTHEISSFRGYYFSTKNETHGYHLLREVMHKIRELNADMNSTETPIINLIRVNEIIKVMAATFDCEYITPEIFCAMLKYVYEHGEAIVGSDRFADSRNNIWSRTVMQNNVGALQTTALLHIAVVFDEFKACTAPLGEVWREDGARNGGWREVVKHRIPICIEYSIYPDYAPTDIPIGYVWTNLGNYISPYVEYPVYYDFPVDDIMGETMSDILIGVVEYVSNILPPNLGSWAVGDGGAIDSLQTSNIRTVSKLWPEKVSELTKYMGSNRQNGTAPTDYTSYVNDSVSRTVLRSDWSENAVSMHMHSSTNNSHTHYDDLAVLIHAYGKRLLADPSVYDYNSAGNEFSAWQTSRDAHNCVTVDGKNPDQKTGGSAHPENRELNNVYDFIHMDTAGYENHFQNRYVLFVRPGYFIVTDHIGSNDESSHNYRLNWHFLPDADISIDDENQQTKTNFTKDANLVVATVSESGELGAEIRQGYYSQAANGGKVEDTYYVTYDKNVVGETSFQTVLYPTQAGESAEIQTEVLASSIAAPDARAMRAIIEDSNLGEIITNYYILTDESQKTDATYGAYKTDGVLALNETIDGDVSTLILRKGSYIEETSTGKKLLALTGEAEDIGISVDESTVTIESSKEDTPITSLTMYVGDKNITQVIYNGNPVEFNKNGSYIYVGGAPAYELPEEDEAGSTEDEDDDSVYVPKDNVPSGSVGGSGGSSKDPEEEKPEPEKPETDNPQTPPEDDKIKPSQAFEKELSDHWAEKELTQMIDEGFVNGKDGSLALSDNITRAEFITVVVRALGLETTEYAGLFADVKENDWYAQSLETANKYGLLDGYDGKADPNAKINREQMAKILANAYELKYGSVSEPEPESSEFTDSKNVSQWAKEYINLCYSLGLMNGYPDGTFAPQANATRAEAFVTIYRLIEK